MGELATIPKSISDNFKSLSIQRKEIASNEHVITSMTPTDSIILNAGSGTMIASMQPEEFKTEMVRVLKEVARDVGIVYWNDNIKMKERIPGIMAFALGYFRDMTAIDIKTAFDLSMTDKLDQYLPKDRSGHPEKKHFQEFNKEYFGRIMNAYRILKRSTWNTANKLLPKPDDLPSDEEKNIYRKSFIDTIYNKFYLYRDRDETPRFLVPALVASEFKRAGVVQGELKVSENNIAKGFILMTQDSNISKYQKYENTARYEDGDMPDAVISKAVKLAYEDLIVRVFDEIIESGLEIEDIVKFKYD